MSEPGQRRTGPQVSPLTPASTCTTADELAASLGSGLQQPILVEEERDSGAGPQTLEPTDLLPLRSSLELRSADAMFINESTSARQQLLLQGHTGARLSLRELATNPLDDEAENVIVRAIEARERREKADAGYQEPVGAGIFGGVTDAALNIVMEEGSDNDSSDGDKKKNDGVALRFVGTDGRPPESSSPSSQRKQSSPTCTKSAASVESYGSNQLQPRHCRTLTTPCGRNTGPTTCNFQVLTNQLKNAQSNRFLSAAAANKSRSDLDLAGFRGSGSDGEDRSNKEYDVDQGRDLCAADAMVRNMNKMLGLPNRQMDVEGERTARGREVSGGGNRILDAAFDIEAQLPMPSASSSRPSPQQPKSAAQNWAKVRLAVKTSTTIASVAAVASELKAGAEAGKAQEVVSNIAESGSAPAPNKNQKDDEPTSYLKALGRVFAVRSQNILGDISSSLNVKFALKVMVGFLIVPSMIVSAILFYGAGNPMPDERGELDQGSYSWWILFIGARQICTLALSGITEILVIDVLTLKSRTLLKLFGPLVSLLIIQARGWPYILTFWGVFNFAFLQGRHSFAKVSEPICNGFYMYA